MAKHALGFRTVFRKKLRAGMTVRNYRDNEVIFSQGDTADAVFYVQSGTVKLTVAATRQKKAIVAVLLRGSFYRGGMAIFRRAKKGVNLKQVLAAQCPTCGAAPGEKCELSTGQPRTDPHRDRRSIAKDQP